MTTTAARYCPECGYPQGVVTAKFCASCGMPRAVLYSGAGHGAQAEPTVELRNDGRPIDRAGTGQYILSFLLAGFIGIWIQYWTRYYGWRGVTISALIFAEIVILYSQW